MQPHYIITACGTRLTRKWTLRCTWPPIVAMLGVPRNWWRRVHQWTRSTSFGKRRSWLQLSLGSTQCSKRFCAEKPITDLETAYVVSARVHIVVGSFTLWHLLCDNAGWPHRSTSCCPSRASPSNVRHRVVVVGQYSPSHHIVGCCVLCLCCLHCSLRCGNCVVNADHQQLHVGSAPVGPKRPRQATDDAPTHGW